VNNIYINNNYAAFCKMDELTSKESGKAEITLQHPLYLSL